MFKIRNPRFQFAILLLMQFIATTCTAVEAAPPAAAIATASEQATETGADILRAGGNAFDAAVAVAAVLAVAEPFNSGLGGGGFFLLHRASDGHDIVIDARETAPAAASSDMYLDAHGKPIPDKSTDGPLAAGIPGIPAALEHLAAHYGRLSLAQSLEPAINLARNGIIVSEALEQAAKSRVDTLRLWPDGAATFLVNGDAPPNGYVLRQMELANTLERIANEGAQVFYHGDIGRRLVDGVRSAGGIWTDQDLANYQVVERAPLVGQYHDMRIVTVPPPSSGGIVMLEALNILEGFRFDPRQPAARKHLIVEAMRRAYRDRAEYLGDADFVKVPLARLLSKQYAESLRTTISIDHATPSAELQPTGAQLKASGANTTHFSVLDIEGNRVAATLSLNTHFGCAFMPPDTGVVLNNEMDDFASAPDQPNTYGLVGNDANAIAPGKRPLSSMSPTFIETAERVGILGTPGGSRIISMVLLGILDFADGHDANSWVRLPRYHHQYLPDRIEAESGAFNDIELAALKRWGHEIKVLDRTYGNMQAILWDRKTGEVHAAFDPRGEGSSVVLRR